MQYFDVVYIFIFGQLGMGLGKKNQKNVILQVQYLLYLQQYSYDKFTEDDLEQVGIVKQMWQILWLVLWIKFLTRLCFL